MIQPQPFCKLVKVNIGKYLFRSIDKHFNQYILHKIFNTKTLKISYSCMRNFFKIITTHNNEIIRKYYDQMNGNNNNNNNNNKNNDNNTSNENDYNYKIKINCPMKGL